MKWFLEDNYSKACISDCFSVSWHPASPRFAWNDKDEINVSLFSRHAKNKQPLRIN